jgi:glycolate oxidase
LDNSVKQALIDIVGQQNFTDALIDRVSYAYDSSDHKHRPDAAVWPTSSDQVSKILTMANHHRFAVTPRGAGTGLAGAAVPAGGGLVLDLCRMNKILGIHIVDRQVVVQPGVVYEDLERSLRPYGFFFPPDPASGKVCTLGGNVATNAGGLRGAKYGVTKDYVMALEVVLPDGRIMRTGSNCMRSVYGYDLTRLFVGSEGTFGVTTEITLKISPKPKAFKTGLALFKSLKDAGQSVADIMHSGVIPSVLEVLDDNSIRVLREHTDMSLPDVMAIILVETDAYTEAEAAFQMARLIDVFRKNGAIDIQAAETPEEAEELWKARKSVGSVASQLRANNISEDVTVPISKVPDLLTGISGIVRKYHLPFVVFGHAGDGNLHPKIMYDPSDPKEVKGVKKAADEIFALTCNLGGTLTGEHGIGLAKAPYMQLEHDAVALDVMRTLKTLFDPNNILNPGKMNLNQSSSPSCESF